jgi:predicted transposase YbfD/YdcC
MVAEFINHFETIEDPRIDRCKAHALLDILFLAISAVLSGSEGYEEIEDFGINKESWLKQYLPFENGIPSHDTISRVFSRLNPEQVQASFISWVSSIIEKVEGQVIAIDGKTARGTFKPQGKENALHMVSAWSCQHQLVLGQQKVAGKSNEITAIPHLLELLDLEGSVITIDAMGCQKSIVAKIIAHKADYVVGLKDNQLGLKTECLAWLHKVEREGYRQCLHAFLEAVDSGHGRIETRRVTQVSIDSNWLSEKYRFAGLQSIIRVDSERIQKEKTSTETRYYISSLPVDAAKAMQVVRSHWQIESMHWMLDMTFKEDASQIKSGNAPEIMNIIRKIALNIIKNDPTKKASIKRKLKMAAINDEYRSTLIAEAVIMR